MSRFARPIVLLLILLPTFMHCASTPPKKKEPPPPPPPLANMSIDELRQEVLEYLEGRMAAPGDEKSANSAQGRDAWRQRAQELVSLFRKRIHEDLMARIEQDFGVNAPLQSETVPLEALDD
ncbi:MAG: hypothetical protein IT364_03675, partial [Candidatus Hydrogenedentes bacterium]|nr:hypothetical protein [Candidatus Hydrogenedentota bacterium]